jgi:hypothetical protein
VVIYAVAAALLLAGGFWWFAAAPADPENPLVSRWQATAVELLPDEAQEAGGGMLTLAAGADQVIESEVGVGGFVVAVVCVGPEGSLLRISLGEPGTDSGRGLRCSSDGAQETFSVSAAGSLNLRVSVNEAGPVVFRYSVMPTLNN